MIKVQDSPTSQGPMYNECTGLNCQYLNQIRIYGTVNQSPALDCSYEYIICIPDTCTVDSFSTLAGIAKVFANIKQLLLSAKE